MPKFNSNTLRDDFESILLGEQAKYPLLYPEGSLRFNTQQRSISWGNRVIVYLGRSFSFLFSNPNEFTLQCVAKGRIPRFTRIMNGWGDWLLYGFQSKKDLKKVARCCLIDLRVFRRYIVEGSIRPVRYDNHDGTEFLVFHLADFPMEMIVFSTHPIEDDRDVFELVS